MQISKRKKQEAVLPSYAYKLQQGVACHNKPYLGHNQPLFNLT